MKVVIYIACLECITLAVLADADYDIGARGTKLKYHVRRQKVFYITLNILLYNRPSDLFRMKITSKTIEPWHLVDFLTSWTGPSQGLYLQQTANHKNVDI
jgi:hypothetical protein